MRLDELRETLKKEEEWETVEENDLPEPLLESDLHTALDLLGRYQDLFYQISINTMRAMMSPDALQATIQLDRETAMFLDTYEIEGRD
jgi:hypothetical protein